MTDEVVRNATKKAIATAKENGLLISFDPNLRPPLWSSLDDAKEQIAYGMSQCDILKISDNEIEFMTGTSDFDKGAAMLQEQYPNIRLLNVTAGADGSYSYYQGRKVFVPSYLLGGTVDTTGAGDSFWGGFLSQFLSLNKAIDEMDWNDLRACARQGNAVACLCVQKRGGIPAIPKKREVMEFLNQHIKK